MNLYFRIAAYLISLILSAFMDVHFFSKTEQEAWHTAYISATSVIIWWFVFSASGPVTRWLDKVTKS